MKQKSLLFAFLILFSFAYCAENEKSVWLGELDISLVDLERGSAQKDKAPRGDGPLVIGGETYEKGVTMTAPAKFLINLNGNGTRFQAEVGHVQRRMPGAPASTSGEKRKEKKEGEKKRPEGDSPFGGRRGPSNPAEFFVLGDKEILWSSGEIFGTDAPKKVDIDISGVKKLALVVKGEGGFPFGINAAWGNAKISYSGNKAPVALPNKPVLDSEPYILTPDVKSEPRINGAKVVGATPGKPFLFFVPVTGKRPMKITADNLPAGLEINSETGLISGTTPAKGKYVVAVTAKNEYGTVTSDIRIEANGRLALTPPMGWNSWNAFGKSVDQEKVMQAANTMAEKLRYHGWNFVNIDDGWQGKERQENGELFPNEKFSDMKKLADYVHSQGLKLGIYSSPGPTTCGRELGSYEHEIQDANTWADWGIDYLKHDWCSYFNIAGRTNDVDVLKEPYLLMRDALLATNRDIVYSLCQYGMGNVWEWGDDVGGNLWRTSMDIEDTWSSLLETGFAQKDDRWKYAKPGNWNDPDMMVIGEVGWGPSLRPTKLSPDEQYSHVSLWCLQASPLLIGCDMAKLDDFTLSLLTNDEVIEVNQDPLGKQAQLIVEKEDYQVWAKDMENGSKAVGIFYTGKKAAKIENPVEMIKWDGVKKSEPKAFAISWDELGISGEQNVRDLWRQEDIGKHSDKLQIEVKYHGVFLAKISPVN